MSSVLTRLRIALGRADADASARAALHSDDEVRVTPGDTIRFLPMRDQLATGVIFYSGGRCDAVAYAPVLRELARAGYPVFVPQMPLRLAVLGSNKAAKIIAENPHIERWIIGGHSMGGAMAGAYAFKHPDQIAGLFLVGSYVANMHAMPDRELPALVVHASRDFVVRKSELDACPARLPCDAMFITIEGGDHYQYGNFASVEHTAAISREEQQSEVIAALLTFIEQFDRRS